MGLWKMIAIVVISKGFYTIGFAEPLQTVLIKIPVINSYIGSYDVLMQKQIIATLIATLVFILAIIGAHFIIKIQMAVFAVLIAALGAILFSPVIIPFTASVSGGSGIFSGGLNFHGFGSAMGFWAAFTAFFPAVTGIDAGVGMSGNLKDPRKSSSFGTFISIGITFFIYLAVTVVFALIRPELLMVTKKGQIPSVVNVFSGYPFTAILLLIGILVATGSSALSYFMTAPITAQSMAQDRILPEGLFFLARDFKREKKEPRWASVLVYLIIIPIIWSGNVAQASMVVGISFLIVYGWVNFAAFMERISKNPSFRPVFHGHWAISLYGFVVCMAVIAMFNIWVGIIVAFSQTIIFVLLLKYKSQNKLEGVWWKGEENGNLLALLAYIINTSDIKHEGRANTIRIIRKISDDDDRARAEDEMEDLLKRARLSGEVLIIQGKDKSLNETIMTYSRNALLILMGIPGEKQGGIARLFSLDRLFFTRKLEKFLDFPPVLFVKASQIFDLVEE
ncbi:MAG: hypothetical protein DRP57_11410 [Spirochaetes bacterium]|nr:MAG: hypothetical protein DRP57_11410 [Spirochaetota bacterium]